MNTSACEYITLTVTAETPGYVRVMHEHGVTRFTDETYVDCWPGGGVGSGRRCS